MVSLRSRGVLLAATALLGGGSLIAAVPATAVTHTVPAAALSGHVSEAQATAAERYWTPQRMREADAASGHAASDVAPQSVGHPKRVGKIFYHFGGKDLSCTGTVVTSGSRDSILTAGHCLVWHGLKVGNDMSVFVPAYYHGQAPYGKWGIKGWAVPEPWAMHQNPSYDYGVIHVKSHHHVRIQSVTGANPYWSHAGWSGRATLVGYPSKYNYSTICGPTPLSKKVINGHKPEYQFQCRGFTNGVSGSPVLIGPGNTLAGEGTVIGVLGGLREGGDPKKDGLTSYANRLDGDFDRFWTSHTR
ncbi:trypsin-like serine peptidase [Streptomyces glomeratus]|uniref:Trypsin-like peptidase domain-containing protein n=1 Tax=Streptomyces glomeratus TaxID=284452 RepID=A0ABP6LM31_9ACTN|nr:hypothetical protein [Streptomyces glomeratus]MCF1512325.1 hypothetical protein [Streptomyces glomeratus]